MQTVTPKRSPDGTWVHPVLLALLGDREEVPHEEFGAWVKSQGIEISRSNMRDDLGDDHPLSIEYDKGGTCAQWAPEAPGTDWHPLSIIDTVESSPSLSSSSSVA
jgi:hypothetical protein